jgi:hypothetical protein
MTEVIAAGSLPNLMQSSSAIRLNPEVLVFFAAVLL